MPTVLTHVILYVEPTISVRNDTNAMLYCKVIGGTIRVVLCFSYAEKLGNYSCRAFSITSVLKMYVATCRCDRPKIA